MVVEVEATGGARQRAAAQPGRVLVLGCGSVSQCTLPLLVSVNGIEPARVTVLDMVDNRERIADLLAQGVAYDQHELTRENLFESLAARLGPGDVLVDLAWNIDACTILQWCHDHGVRYLNTSVEVWDPYEGAAGTSPLERTLYVRHLAIRRMAAAWDRPGPTAVLEHGANPGLVSHFTKRALTEIGPRVLSAGKGGSHAGAIEAALGAADHAALARALDVKVIHISERDTQISNRPKEVDEFVNTWSVDGFYEEGIAPAELGWGTHERRLPPGALVHAGTHPGNQICLAQAGMKTWVRSWVPCGEITGMVIRHGEAFTISDHLTVWEDGRPAYRPTVHYAYCPADVAISSMHELEMRQLQLQPRQRIMNDEITSGRDELGVLLMGHPLTAWWTGSLLSIDEARTLVPHQNATTLQVAASIVGALAWMLEHPEEGVCVPDDLPWEDVLRVASPYLGPMHSDAVEWDPVSSRVDLYAGWNGRFVDRDDPWQFGNFLV
jgi:homospermidine synthase